MANLATDRKSFNSLANTSTDRESVNSLANRSTPALTGESVDGQKIVQLTHMEFVDRQTIGQLTGRIYRRTDNRSTQWRIRRRTDNLSSNCIKEDYDCGVHACNVM